MNIGKKATEAAPETGNKNNTKNHIRATVRALFLSGRKLTAREINMITCSNDARKVISELRRSGWNITDLRCLQDVNCIGLIHYLNKKT